MHQNNFAFNFVCREVVKCLREKFIYLNRFNIPFVHMIHLLNLCYLQNQHQYRLSAKPSIRLVTNSKLARAICSTNTFLIEFSPLNFNFHQTCFPFRTLWHHCELRCPGVRQCSIIVKITGNGKTGLSRTSVSYQLRNPRQIT